MSSFICYIQEVFVILLFWKYDSFRRISPRRKHRRSVPRSFIFHDQFEKFRVSKNSIDRCQRMSMKSFLHFPKRNCWYECVERKENNIMWCWGSHIYDFNWFECSFIFIYFVIAEFRFCGNRVCILRNRFQLIRCRESGVYVFDRFSIVCNVRLFSFCYFGECSNPVLWFFFSSRASLVENVSVLLRL